MNEIEQSIYDTILEYYPNRSDSFTDEYTTIQIFNDISILLENKEVLKNFVKRIIEALSKMIKDKTIHDIKVKLMNNRKLSITIMV